MYFMCVKREILCQYHGTMNVAQEWSRSGLMKANGVEKGV